MTKEIFSADLYEILVSNEGTHDQVVRLLDEKYHHPHVTIMASHNGKQVDKFLSEPIKERTLRVKHTRIWLTELPQSIDDKGFFKQLEFHLLKNQGGAWPKVPINFEMHPDQQQPCVCDNFTEYHLDAFTVIELNMPPLTEIKIQLLIK